MLNSRYGFGERLIRGTFPFLIFFAGSVLATTSGSTGPVFGRQITINDPVVLYGALVFTSTAPAVTDPDGESVDHWLYQWKVDGVAAGAESATTKADFSEISYKARSVDFNRKLQLCVKAVSPAGCYPDSTCRSDSVCSAEVDISEPVVYDVAVSNDPNTVNNALADGVSENVVRIEVRSADGRYSAPGYPVTLTASNGAIIQNSITTNNVFAYPRIKSNTAGESVITATTGYGLSKQITVNFLPKIVGITTARYSWADAATYCGSLGARLPTQADLQNTFLTLTSATAVGGNNTSEMCDNHGWPLHSGQCGGSTLNYWVMPPNYAVSMANGEFSGPHPISSTAHVACVR